jgi:hypothetical protein
MEVVLPVLLEEAEGPTPLVDDEAPALLQVLATLETCVLPRTAVADRAQLLELEVWLVGLLKLDRTVFFQDSGCRWGTGDVTGIVPVPCVPVAVVWDPYCRHSKNC